MPTGKKTSTLAQLLLKGGGGAGGCGGGGVGSLVIIGSCTQENQAEEAEPIITCMPTLPSAAGKLGEAYGQWRQEQRARAWRLECQLASGRALEDLIDAHLAHYTANININRPARPRDVPHLLLPPWKHPLENAALSWLGDCRPSAILSLIPTLSSFSPSPTGGGLLDLCPRARRTLAEAIRRLRVQEAVLDEEAAEHQSTAVLTLPFDRAGRKKAWRAVVKEMRKAEELVARAHRLRCRALEVAVRDVLDRAQAAEFLVAFVGIQDAAHCHAARWRAHVGPVFIAVQGT